MRGRVGNVHRQFEEWQQSLQEPQDLPSAVIEAGGSSGEGSAYSRHMRKWQEPQKYVRTISLGPLRNAEKKESGDGMWK